MQRKATEVRSSSSIGDEITVLIYCQRAVLYQMEGTRNRQCRQGGERTSPSGIMLMLILDR